jgi:hypothetical protein
MLLEIVLIIIALIQLLRLLIEAMRYSKDYTYEEEEMSEEVKRMFS